RIDGRGRVLHLHLGQLDAAQAVRRGEAHLATEASAAVDGMLRLRFGDASLLAGNSAVIRSLIERGVLAHLD
ncbi:MAG TPA: hypothetical protein VEL28_03520, partial [Candidatus Binatia bacterium]|nr:hypothetical protein [Candidatus Binatia bacterium]